MNFSGLEMGGVLRPNAYNECHPINKMILRETVSALLCLSPAINVLLNIAMERKQ